MAKLPLTVTEVSAMLGVGRTAINRAIERGRIKATLKAGVYWIEPSEVEKYRRLYHRPRRKPDGD